MKNDLMKAVEYIPEIRVGSVLTEIKTRLEEKEIETNPTKWF